VDELAVSFTGADGARVLPKALRGRLQRVLLKPAEAIVEELRELDAPQAIPWALQQRLELSLKSEVRRKRQTWRLFVLVPAAVIATGAAALALYRVIETPEPTQRVESVLPRIPDPAPPPPPAPEPPAVAAPEPPAPVATPRPSKPKPPPEVVKPPIGPPPAPEPPAPAPPPPPEPACGPIGGAVKNVTDFLPPPLGGNGGLISTIACSIPGG
jgi:hypothetical protein